MPKIRLRSAVFKRRVRSLQFAWLTILVFTIAGSQHAQAQTTPSELQTKAILLVLNTLLLSEDAPALVLDKSSDRADFTGTGQTITYSYLLTNNSKSTLYAPYSILDDQISVTCPVTPTSLAPGGTVTCSQTYDTVQADIDAGSIVNIASATAKDAASNGSDVTSATDKVTVNGPAIAPALTLGKSSDVSSYSATGQTITYSYLLTNSGNTTLYAPYSISDDQISVTCPATPAALAPNGTVTCSQTYDTVQADIDARSIVNIASATAKDAASDGSDVTSATDTVTVCADSDIDTLCDDLEYTLFGNLDQVAKEGDGDNWDFDGDGVSNGDEIHIYLSNAKSVDSDGDGIEDGAEVFLGLDLNVAAGLGDTIGGDTPADKALMHKLNRLTFGPTQAELDQIAALAGGFNEWLTAQMAPIGLPLAPPRNNNAVSPLYNGDIYPLPYDCDDVSYNPVDPAQRMRDCYVSRRDDDAGIPATFRPMHSTKQLQSRMAMFWDNHFNTDLRSHNRGMQELMDEDNWFVNAFGNFRTLLELNTKNYTMLEYLDLDDNRKYSPNENFPREILELHSVGINGEYTALDIAQLAYILTGWDHADVRDIGNLCTNDDDIITCAPYVMRYAYRDDADNDLDGTGETGLEESARFDPARIFYYKSNDHDDGLSDYDGDGVLTTTKTLYAGLPYEITIVSQNGALGQDEGEEALDFLATHPNTAKFICKKLAQEFVSDTPLVATTDNCETVFLANPSEADQMGLVLANLLGSIEFNDPTTQRNKLKDTQEVMLSIGRLLGWDASHPGESYRDSLASWIGDAEQPLFYKAEPTGYYEPAENWLDTNIALKRFRGLNNMVFDPQTQSFVVYFRDQLGFTGSVDIMQYLFLTMLGGHYDGHDIQLGMEYLNKVDPNDPNNHAYQAFDFESEYAELRIRALIAYLAALPEFQLH